MKNLISQEARKRESRFLSRELRVKRNDAGQPQIQGYAAVFNSMSQDLGGFREVIAPGAFAADLANNPDVRALFNHDESLILGRTKSGTLQLSEDETGLFWVCTLPDTAVARDLMVSIERGDVDQCSFGFFCLDDEWQMQDGTPLRTVKTAGLFDVSAVTYPAYEATSVGVRSLWRDGQPESIKKAIEGLQNCDNGTDSVTHNEYCNCVDLCAPLLRMRLVAASL